MQYAKPALTLDQQVALLKRRGMVIADDAAAKAVLERISYYRLSAYALHLRQHGTDDFAAGATFTATLELYEFDSRLRNLVWEALESVEVLIRTRITYHLATAYGAYAHVDPNHFVPTQQSPRWDHAKWLSKVEDEAQRSHEIFVDHFKRKYSGFPQLPLWMATEIMSFGSLSKLYGAMFVRDQRVVARGLDTLEAYLPSWIHSLSVIRNTCAHHGRLWDRGLGVKPKLPNEPIWRPPSGPRSDRIGCVLLMINKLLGAGGLPSCDTWRGRVEHLVTPFLQKDARWAGVMGLPPGWPSHPLWS